MAFKEKVGDIYADLSLNMDKKSQKKAEKDSESFIKRFTGKIGSALKKGLGSKLGLASIIAMVTGLLMRQNKQLSENVDYWDLLITQADSLKVSFKDIQRLQMVATLGDLPDFKSFTDNFIEMEKKMAEISQGIHSEGSDFLRQVGVKGTETDRVKVMQKVIESLSKSDRSVGDYALDQIFGSIDAESKGFFMGSGLKAFEDVDKGITSGKINLVDESKAGEIASIDNELKILAWNKKVAQIDNLALNEAVKIAESADNISESLDVSMGILIPLVGQLAKALTDFLNAFPKVFSLKEFKNMFSSNKVSRKEMLEREKNRPARNLFSKNG